MKRLIGVILVFALIQILLDYWQDRQFRNLYRSNSQTSRRYSLDQIAEMDIWGE